MISYKDIPVEVHQLPSTTNTQTVEQQLKENRKTIKEILCMDPYQYKVRQQLSTLFFSQLSLNFFSYQLFNNICLFGYYSKKCRAKDLHARP